MKCFLLLVAVYTVTLIAHLTEACADAVKISDKLGENGLLGKETIAIKGNVALNIGTQVPLIGNQVPLLTNVHPESLGLPGTQLPGVNNQIPLGSSNLPGVLDLPGTQLPLVEFKTPVGSGILPGTIDLPGNSFAWSAGLTLLLVMGEFAANLRQRINS
ncbi:hypothetical protein XELAEV_18034979mg [Xenopus laevis]|uniref:Uncharacterized protein n=1 Tax=Xenopus laevis TaxID=8355 RepID=A0A974CEU8_XENLA|nr:hypothetical protein XELAEV_18034979mg [Xenopus laevis]